MWHFHLLNEKFQHPFLWCLFSHGQIVKRQFSHCGTVFLLFSFHFSCLTDPFLHRRRTTLSLPPGSCYFFSREPSVLLLLVSLSLQNLRRSLAAFLSVENLTWLKIEGVYAGDFGSFYFFPPTKWLLHIRENSFGTQFFLFTAATHCLLLSESRGNL